MFIKKIQKILLALGRNLLLCVIALFVKPLFFLKKKPIWFIADRPYGIDNGYWFYLYCKEREKAWDADGYDDIEYIYLCKDRDDVIYKRLEWEEHADSVVTYYSWRHIWTFLHADVLIYAYDTAPFYMNNQWLVFKYLLTPTAKHVFLSHGVTRGYVDAVAYKNTHFDAYCAIGDREKDIIENKLEQKNVVVTWYPRHDMLVDSIRARDTTWSSGAFDFSGSFGSMLWTTWPILFMPAWRFELSFGGEDAFVASEYYARIQSFLSSPALHRLLESADQKLIWLPHQYLREYLHCFDMSDWDDRYIVLNHGPEKRSISELFQEWSLLITDNSWAHFDFAYMKKPVIHYDFYPYHYEDIRLEEGNIGALGEWIKTEDALIDRLRWYMEHAYRMPDMYQDRVDEFFAYQDGLCRERVYELVKELTSS